jgi:hypothetical protein
MKRVLTKILEEFLGHLNLEKNSNQNPFEIPQEFCVYLIF